MFALAVCMDEKFALNGAMALWSAIQHLDDHQVLAAYVLDNGISESTRSKLVEIFAKQKEIRLSWVHVDPEIINNLPLPEDSWLSPATYARIFLPDLVSPDVEKLLYIDSDTLVRHNVHELSSLDMQGNALAACVDDKYKIVRNAQARSCLKRLGLVDDDKYFNAGVILFELKRWRELNLTQRSIELVQNHGLEFSHADQDALNAALSQHWCELGWEWNVTSNYYDASFISDESKMSSVKLIHYTGPNPGTSRCTHPERQLFYQYVRDSDWFGNRSNYIKWRVLIKKNKSVNLLKSLVKAVLRK